MNFQPLRNDIPPEKLMLAINHILQDIINKLNELETDIKELKENA